MDTLEQHQHEVCNAFARAAVAMRDAASTAENFSIWFSRVNNLQSVPLPPSFNGAAFNLAFSNYSGAPQHVASSPVEQTGKKRKSMDDQEGKKKRAPKKPKDANAPKRPPSPYILFQNEIRKTIQEKKPDIPYTQVLTEIAKMWKEMTPDQKAPYQRSQAILKAKYEQKKDEYDQNMLSVAAKASAAPTAALDKSAEGAESSSSGDSSGESTESSSSSEGGGEEDDAVPAPEPPRKKPKKETSKLPTPPPAKVSPKVEKKDKSVEEKKKKKKKAADA